jgi:hypothetical protein
MEDTGFNDERFRSSRDIDERIGKWSKAKWDKNLMGRPEVLGVVIG